MQTYPFDCIASDGSIYNCDVAMCASDEEALAKAAVLFNNHRDAVAIDIWVDGVLLSRVMRAPSVAPACASERG